MLISREDKPEPGLYSVLKHEDEIETYLCKMCGKEEKTLKKIWEHVDSCKEEHKPNQKKYPLTIEERYKNQRR